MVRLPFDHKARSHYNRKGRDCGPMLRPRGFRCRNVEPCDRHFGAQGNRDQGERRYKARPRKLVLGGPCCVDLQDFAEIRGYAAGSRLAGPWCLAWLLGQFLAEHADAVEPGRDKGLGRVSLVGLLWRQAQVDPAQARFLAKSWLDDGDDQEDTNNATPVLTDEARPPSPRASGQSAAPDRPTDTDDGFGGISLAAGGLGP